MTKEEHTKEAFKVYSMTNEEVEAVINSGMANKIIQGYCFKALDNIIALTEKEKTELKDSFNSVFDSMNAAEAKEFYNNY